MEGHWKFRGGDPKAKILKGKYRAKLKIPGGWGWGEWGVQTKKPSVEGGYGFFLEPHILTLVSLFYFFRASGLYWVSQNHSS